MDCSPATLLTKDDWELTLGSTGRNQSLRNALVNVPNRATPHKNMHHFSCFVLKIIKTRTIISNGTQRQQVNLSSISIYLPRNIAAVNLTCITKSMMITIKILKWPRISIRKQLVQHMQGCTYHVHSSVACPVLMGRSKVD